MKKTVRAAFVSSLPVLMGYLSMGAAFGVLLSTSVKGAGPFTAFCMSTSTISGSMQFAAVDMLKNPAAYSLLLTFLLAVLINIRYVMYGFPFIRLFSNYPWYLKWYLTIALTDETYAIMTQDERTGKEKQLYLFCVAFFDHCYWITGSVLGAAAGKFITFNTEGIDFAMAALFIVILVDLCRKKVNWIPAVVGTTVTALTLVVFLQMFPAHINKMLLPAMLLLVGVLLLLRKKISVEERA
ncbi:MAG: AzlC family ABC transporter permease [Lentisphaeria bacterium]|nr:AzlC family ABC transporter permease [Lentisphaeria bacterium]